MKIYQLTAKKGKKDLLITIHDLIPICHRRSYSFMELTELFDYSLYETDWKTPMEEEWKTLYKIKGNKWSSFFKVKHTDLIVIPGMFIYPTALNEQRIKEMDHYYIK